ncbi:hypothetical protein DNTS_024891 [Danionella cerebrum]|uniref:non-specific serine/threonine protein kinase n=1 Tax=Danionella cerebrum TaxID=2873325 RepID=A0A553QSB1_9TELE|nr:hypothetical protein DNTS_024891 [Danionella translucida]
MSANSSLVSSSVISPDPLVIISDSGIISKIDYTETSRADGENKPFHHNPVPKEIGLSILAGSGPYCPNIIQLLDWEDFPEYYIMVLEHPLAYIDLEKLLRFRGVLNEIEAVDHVVGC